MRNLLVKYEAKNTTVLRDVNTGEDDIIQLKNEDYAATKAIVTNKINQMDATIANLKKKLTE